MQIYGSFHVKFSNEIKSIKLTLVSSRIIVREEKGIFIRQWTNFLALQLLSWFVVSHEVFPNTKEKKKLNPLGYKNS